MGLNLAGSCPLPSGLGFPISDSCLWADTRGQADLGALPYRMMSVYSRSLPLLSFHFLYMTEASTLAGEKVLGSLRREMTLRRMVLGEEGVEFIHWLHRPPWKPGLMLQQEPQAKHGLPVAPICGRMHPALQPFRPESQWGSFWAHPEASTHPDTPWHNPPPPPQEQYLSGLLTGLPAYWPPPALCHMPNSLDKTCVGRETQDHLPYLKHTSPMP